MIEDAQLLSRYVENNSEEAFAELVRRHIDFVYSVALRQVGGDPHLAQDVTQMVFVALARKSAALARRPVLGGWLYRTTQFAGIDAVRAESRRRARDHAAHTMQELSAPDPTGSHDFEKLRPLLDRAIGELRDPDRDAVVLRFFNGCSFAEIGARLRLNENAARMRVDRALDKLRALLERRGVTSTSIALATALANHGMIAAPAGLAASVTGAAVASGSGLAAGSTLFMGMTKLQIGIAGAIALAGAGGVVVQSHANAALRDEWMALQRHSSPRSSLESGSGSIARTASENERVDARDGELARLRDEAAMLHSQLQTITARIRKAEAAPEPPPPFTGPFLEPDQVDQRPRPVNQARPMYPAELRKMGVIGQATVDCIVDTNGVVHNARAVTMTHAAFGASAVEAVSKWQFEPALKGGQAVAMRLQQPVYFRMEGKSDSPPASTPAGKTAKPAFVPWF